MTTNNDQRLHEAHQYWDRAAATFDEQPDHGLHDPLVRAAWRAQLTRWLPPAPASILDAGCGTGSLSVLLAELGYRVTGLDLSPAMATQAATKAEAAQQQVTFMVMDAANPQLAPQSFDVVLCRHVLWALPEQAAVLRRWCELLTPGGRLVLIEGHWHTGAGLHAREIIAALPPRLGNVLVHDLSGQPALWGAPVADERYAVVAEAAIVDQG